jgi:hypothetical protein
VSSRDGWLGGIIIFVGDIERERESERERERVVERRKLIYIYICMLYIYKKIIILLIHST